MCQTNLTASSVSTQTSRPLASFKLTRPELEALVDTWNLGLVATLHPEIRHYRIVLKAGEVRVFPPRPATWARGKQVIARRAGETAWLTLMRLGAQACINGCAVRPLDNSLTRFAVTSQEADADGTRDTYLVAVAHGCTCSCKRGSFRLGEPCSHIGATYLWLQGLRGAPAPVRTHDEITARAAAAAADLFGMVA